MIRMEQSKRHLILWRDLCTTDRIWPHSLIVIILVLLGGALRDTSIHAGAADTTDVLEGIEVLHDESKDVTRYEPTQDRWSPYEYKFYPLIVVARDGRRMLHLHASTQNERRMRLIYLEIEVDGVSHTREFDRRDVNTDDSGCRDTETIELESNSDLIEGVADATNVTITFIGSRYRKDYELAAYDLSVFKRMVALYEADRLPEISDKDGAEVTAAESGEGMTNPRLIGPSKVDPEFPKVARAKKKSGTVRLHAVVRKDGSAEVIEVLRSTTPYCGFETAAIAAVEQWRYKPGFKEGQAVDFYFTVDIDFTWR